MIHDCCKTQTKTTTVPNIKIRISCSSSLSLSLHWVKPLSVNYSSSLSLPEKVVQLLLEDRVSFMDDSSRRLKVIPDHFQVSTSNSGCLENNTSSIQQPKVDELSRLHSQSWTRRKLRTASVMLNLFSLRGLPWGSGSGQEKVVLTAVEVATLRSEIADLEEREAHLKAQLEHIDEVLRSARLSGYLYIRTRWAALPGEPPPIDDNDIDDWLPRFVVLHGACLYFYLSSTDLSPQDSTLLADVVEIGHLPCITPSEDGDTRYAFYISTRQGLRYECSNTSKMQVVSWLLALQSDCKLGCGNETPDSNNETGVKS